MEIILEIQFYLGNNINSDFDVTKINVHNTQCSFDSLVMDFKINFPIFDFFAESQEIVSVALHHH